jgi:hypothetical protein
MKNLACILLILAVTVGLTGCQSTFQTWDQIIIANQSLIKSAAQLATATAMLSVIEADRPAAARLSYEIAVAIEKASATQTDLSGVDAIAQQYLSQWNSPYKVVVGSIVNTLETIVQSYIQSFFANAPNDTKIKALQSFLQSASQGVESGSLPYTQGFPQVPTTKTLKLTKTITVVPFIWNQPKK